MKRRIEKKNERMKIEIDRRNIENCVRKVREREKKNREKNKERLNQRGECEKVKGGERMGRN